MFFPFIILMVGVFLQTILMLISMSLSFLNARIGELPSLPPHCGCLCHHVGLIFCHQGLKRTRIHFILSSASDHVGLFFCCLHSKKYKSRVGDFESLAGLGDSHLWWGTCQPFLCSAHHLCQGDIHMFNECQLELERIQCFSTAGGAS